ncbi:MAG: mannonate dehydratase [Phenylobacterium sp.]|uniref:mannonate dehydratase n=1 Tax=Phenylobacterium sp. TaxID=1871053 RepID=UPI0027373465|nr:mannonate dehydratase [Phenylobacterium sp.]MDP3749378.1 mannonate dehydratase [Phenylobacterium sp.]
MDRRAFMSLAGLGVSAGTVSPAVAGSSLKPLRMKLGCQSLPSDEARFSYFARYGVRNICAKPQIAEGRLYATVAEIGTVRDAAARFGVSVDILEPPILRSSHIDREPHPAIMLAESPERDRDIEAFQTMIRNAALAGVPCIKYNMSLLGVLRTATVKGRGDAQYEAWDLQAARPPAPLTRAGRVDAAAAWERIAYFLDRVVPVAEEYKVRLACHPQDPGVPPAGYQGVDRVLGTIEGLKRFVSIRESPYHGLNFCQGTVSEALSDPPREIHDVISWFGARKKIFNVHFRNIRGRRDRFVEVFPDEGDIDMAQAIRTYREVGYDGMLMPDHVPFVEGSPTARSESFAFCYGYIRGLLQAESQRPGS